MATINELKEQEVLETPLLLFECETGAGQVERWSTHGIQYDGDDYEPRVLQHNALETRSLSNDGIDALSRIVLTLANADSHFSQIERSAGWKGAKLTVRFLFFNLALGEAASESVVIFKGVANPPDEITEAAFRLSFSNRLGLQRILLPPVRIQRRCPWTFPATEEQRAEAMAGGAAGRFSPFYRCGYSAGAGGGVGNLDNGQPFSGCGYTREQCEERGMFREDQSGNPTRRFGGVEYLPASIMVRSYGEKGHHLSSSVENQARYNDFVPLVYGTAWYEPPVVFARNDGNLTHLEILLGMGEIEGVVKVIVNNIEIPEGVAGSDMTASGWYTMASNGRRTGEFNYDFQDDAGNPLGDPYGSMAFLSVVAPNDVNDGRALPRVQVLLDGLKLETFDSNGVSLGMGFSKNPAWVLLDLLLRCGWRLAELDIASFHAAAQHCDEQIAASDLHGNAVIIPRFACNLVVRKRRSAADLIRGVRGGSGMYLAYGAGGLLELHAESSVAAQQPEKPGGSNSTIELASGWPAYEFGDGSSEFSGILRRDDGSPAVRFWSKPTADTPNRYSVEFQDEFNEYQQDSLSVVDVDDALTAGQEICASLTALGIPNFSQAARVVRRQLDKDLRGNVFVEFETSVRAIGLKPGDIITLTYLKEGYERQPFRVTRIAAGSNHHSARITAQIHDDAWYGDTAGGSGSSVSRRQRPGEIGLPRPLTGSTTGEFGTPVFEVTEKASDLADGGVTVTLSVEFIAPALPGLADVGIPLVSLTADTDSTGGTLGGGQNLYYAISAVDGQGNEGGLSFVVRATIPAGTGTNRVTLSGMSFPGAAAGFNVYRGPNPSQLLRIASVQPTASEFVDTGLTPTLGGPPDANYDHARFYWRLERVPEHEATVFSATTIGSSVLQMIGNEHTGALVRITGGAGAGQERLVAGNDASTLILEHSWTTMPDSTSRFVVAEASWRLGAASASSPVEFEVPNREGVTVHISGRSVNARGGECSYELSPLTRYTIGGAAAAGGDQDVAGQPGFGLNHAGQGTVELVGVGFEELENTRSIEAGTLNLHYWDELGSPTPCSLAASIGAGDFIVELNQAGPGTVGSLIQIDSEIIVVEEVLDGGLRYEVTRGSHDTSPGSYAAGKPVYHLQRKVFVAPFVTDFFGSPASGSFSFPIHLPDVRIGAAELFVTNSRGNSESARNAFTGVVDRGLRTLSGGQLSIQVGGNLAIESNAAPPLVIEASHSVRDVFAVVRTAPTGGPIELELRQDGDPYCALTIPAGETISNIRNGFELPPLREKSELSLNILSVSQTADTMPGAGLTVTIRL